MKKLLGLVFGVFVLQFFFVSCGEDFVETGIEGQWQLKHKVDANGGIHPVDTIFYSFKKNVFRYLKRNSDVDGDVSICFGNYTESEGRIAIKIEEGTFEPWQWRPNFDWETYSREFVIKKHKNNRLELNLGDTLYVLRKY